MKGDITVKKNIPSPAKSRFIFLDDLIPVIQEQIDAGRNVKFSPRGVSMLPMLRQGIDSVELSGAPERLEKYDIVLYRRDSGQYVLHRIVGINGTYTCIGDAQFDKEFGIRRDQIIAVVTSFYRGGRHRSVKNVLYRLYCRIWHYSRGIRRFIKNLAGWLKRHVSALFSHSEK